MYQEFNKWINLNWLPACLPGCSCFVISQRSIRTSESHRIYWESIWIMEVRCRGKDLKGGGGLSEHKWKYLLQHTVIVFFPQILQIHVTNLTVKSNLSAKCLLAICTKQLSKFPCTSTANSSHIGVKKKKKGSSFLPCSLITMVQ